jgi:hypothetical protein
VTACAPAAPPAATLHSQRSRLPGPILPDATAAPRSPPGQSASACPSRLLRSAEPGRVDPPRAADYVLRGGSWPRRHRARTPCAVMPRRPAAWSTVSHDANGGPLPAASVTPGVLACRSTAARTSLATAPSRHGHRAAVTGEPRATTARHGTRPLAA